METQDQEYMDEPIRPGAMPFMTPMQQYGASMLQMTSPEDEMARMEMALKSQVLDKDGNIKQIGKPLLNDEGINSIMSQTQAIVSRTTIMSNFNDKEIPILVDYLGDTLAKDLMLNRIAYGIETKAARTKIYYIALTSAYICLKRAFEQGERGFWGRIQQEIRNYVEGGNQGGNFFQKLLGWGSKH